MNRKSDTSLNSSFTNTRSSEPEQTSSYTVMNKGNHFSLSYVFSIALWWAFFTPIAAKDQIENGYGLTYTEVHAVSLYAGLGIFVLSIPAYFIWWKGKTLSS